MKSCVFVRNSCLNSHSDGTHSNSCLNSHSDGTHSLQKIHWWARDVILIFPNPFWWRNKLIYSLWWSGWYFSANFHFWVNYIFKVKYNFDFHLIFLYGQVGTHLLWASSERLVSNHMEIKHPAPFQVTLNHFCIVVQWLIKQLMCRRNDAPVHRCIQNAAVTICTTSLCLNVLSNVLLIFLVALHQRDCSCGHFYVTFPNSWQLFSCFGVSAFVKLNVWFFNFLLWFKRKRWGFLFGA